MTQEELKNAVQEGFVKLHNDLFDICKDDFEEKDFYKEFVIAGLSVAVTSLNVSGHSKDDAKHIIVNMLNGLFNDYEK